MILFLYGPDTYRSRQKLNEIIEHYKKIHKSGLNLKFFDLKEKRFEDLADEIKTTPMFSEKKLLVFKNTTLNKDFQDKFLKNIKKFSNSKDIFLFYEDYSPPITSFRLRRAPEDKFSKSLKKYGKSQEFKLLEDWQLRNWVKREFKNFGTEIKETAVKKLVDFVGNNLWQMENEIKKLVNYKNKTKIEIKDVELLVKPKIETDIFETIDAIASKNKKRALKLLKGHLEKGDSPLYLLSMINFQFRNLLVIKDLIEKHQSPYSLTNLHPYVIKKSSDFSKKFKLFELKKIYQKIFEIDLAIKTGKIEPEIALDLLIAEIYPAPDSRKKDSNLLKKL